jgi:hypothetical protein
MTVLLSALGYRLSAKRRGDGRFRWAYRSTIGVPAASKEMKQERGTRNLWIHSTSFREQEGLMIAPKNKSVSPALGRRRAMDEQSKADTIKEQTDEKTGSLDTSTTRPRGSPGTDPTNPHNQEPSGHWVANERAAERSNNEPGLTDRDRKQRRW